MSGSGGGNDSGGGGQFPGAGNPMGQGGTNTTDECGNLSARTTLNSPQAAVIGRLKVGDVLIVRLRIGGPEIVVALFEGQEVGSITFTQLITLIACLKQGFPYVADVLAIKGGGCEVMVRPGSQK